MFSMYTRAVRKVLVSLRATIAREWNNSPPECALKKTKLSYQREKGDGPRFLRLTKCLSTLTTWQRLSMPNYRADTTPNCTQNGTSVGKKKVLFHRLTPLPLRWPNWLTNCNSIAVLSKFDLMRLLIVSELEKVACRQKFELNEISAREVYFAGLEKTFFFQVG